MGLPNFLRPLVVLTVGVMGAALLVLTPTVAHAWAEVTDRRVVTGELADGETLDVAVKTGRIEIATWSRDEARIETFLTVAAGGETRAREVLEGVRIAVRREGDRLVVRTEEPRHMDGGLFGWLTGDEAELSVHHRITLPDGAHAELGTVVGGIGVLRSGGALRASTVQGHIALAGVAGPVEASTVDGGITLELATSPKDDMALSTIHGGMTLDVAPGVRASIDASTGAGRVMAARELGLDTDPEDQRWATGDLAGGGAEVKLEAAHGVIRIRPTPPIPPAETPPHGEH